MARRIADDRLEQVSRLLLEGFGVGDGSLIQRCLEELHPAIEATALGTAGRMHNCLPPHMTPQDVVADVWLKLRTSGGPTQRGASAGATLLAWVKVTTHNYLLDLDRRHKLKLAKSAEVEAQQTVATA